MTRMRAVFCAGCALTTLLLLNGCAFGPGGRAPQLDQPSHYGANAPVTRTVVAQGVSQELAHGAQAQARWWEQYGSEALTSLVSEALNNNLDLEVAQRRLSAAQESWQAQSGASRLPSLDIGGQAARQREMGLPLPAASSTMLYNTFVGQAQARYTFDFFGAIRYENKALAARVGQQAFELQAARNAVAANVVTAAITVAGSAAQVGIVQRLLVLNEQEATDAARQHVLGAVPRATVLDARRRTASLASQLPELKAQLLAARHALAVLLGRRPDQAPAEIDFSQLTVPPQIPVVVPSVLLASRPDILAAEAALNAAAADVGQATASMFPQLALTASMGQGGFDWSTALSGAGAIWSVAASISQPIFRGGALRAQRRAADQTYQATVASYKKAVLSAFQEVADALATVEHDNLALAQADAARLATQELLAISQERVRLGALPAAAARSLQQQLAQAELDTLRYAGSRLLDTATLFHTMGDALPLDTDPSNVAK